MSSVDWLKYNKLCSACHKSHSYCQLIYDYWEQQNTCTYLRPHIHNSPTYKYILIERDMNNKQAHVLCNNIKEKNANSSFNIIIVSNLIIYVGFIKIYTLNYHKTKLQVISNYIKLSTLYFLVVLNITFLRIL